MKRILLSCLILAMSVSGLSAAGNQDEVTAVSSDVTTIQIVGKDFSPDDEMNVLHLQNIEAGFEAATGKKVKLELVSVPEGALGHRDGVLRGSHRQQPADHPRKRVFRAGYALPDRISGHNGDDPARLRSVESPG